MTDTEMSARRAAEFVANLSWDAIPAASRRQAQLTLRDTLGTLLGGIRTDSAKMAASFAEGEGSGGGAPVLVSGRRQGRVLAAFANSVAASALDYDDGYYLGGGGHTGAVVVPALLSACVGHGTSTTVRDFLCAQISAYEVAMRIGHLVNPSSGLEGHHYAGTAASVGAAAGVARLLGLDEQGIEQAIRISWSHTPVAHLQHPMIKESMGWSSATAVAAGLLAETGFHASCGEETRNVYGMPSTPLDSEVARLDPFVTGLGSTFESANTYLKPYAACRRLHAAADALLEMLEEYRIGASDVATVTVYTQAPGHLLSNRRPTSMEHAQYSFPFVLGAIAWHRAAGPEQISKENLPNEHILDFANRVYVEHDPHLDSYWCHSNPSRVAVVTHSGSTFEKQRLKAKGDPGKPMAEAELRNKFLSLVVPALGRGSAETLADLSFVEEGGTVDDVLALMLGSRSAVGSDD